MTSSNGPKNPSPETDIPAFLRSQPDDAVDASVIEENTPATDTVVATVAAPSPSRAMVPLAKIRKPLDERAVVTMPVPTEDQLAEALDGVLPNDEFKLHWIDKLPSFAIRLAGQEKAAILSTFSEQRRAHVAIMTGDEKIQKAVGLGLANEKDGAAAFKGIRSLISSPTLNTANPSTFRVLMKGTGQLGIAHPASLGEGAAITLAQQLHKKHVSDPLLGETLSDIGDIGTRSKKAANVAWPILNAYYQQGKIKGDGIPKFMSDSGTMADKWNSLRPDILPALKNATIKYATAKDKGFLQATFDAVKVAATQDPKAGLDICLDVHNAAQGQPDFPKEILEDAAIYFVAPLVDAKSLMALFEREARRSPNQPSEAVALRGLLHTIDDSGMIAHCSNTTLVEVFDTIWIAHAFNEQSMAEADQADFEADHDMGVLIQERRDVLQRLDEAENVVLNKRDTIVEDREDEIRERTAAAIKSQAGLFQPTAQNG